LAERSGWDAVASARTRTLDAGEGFKKMAEHAEPSFAPIVEAFLELHTRHAAELSRILTDAGQPPQDDGSVMGTINRLVVATRAFLDDIDGDVLKQIHSGEENVASAYQDALSADLPAQVRNRLAVMLAELNELLADTRPID
jgi:uncharacterized protein (TIGR02284 family)